MKKNSKSEAASNLRQQAEELLKKKTAKNVSELSETEIQKALHELAVYQIELEMQNNELMLLKSDAEKSTQKYIALYDFAPSGYFTISKAGEIIELNLRGATLLDKERSKIKKSQFTFFLTDETKAIFNNFLENIFKGKTNESCDVAFLASDNAVKYFHLTGTLNENEEECLAIAIDITVKKTLDLKLKIAYDRLEQAEKIVGLGNWEVELATGKISWSKQMYKHFGLDHAGEPFGFDNLDMIHPEDHEKVRGVNISFSKGEIPTINHVRTNPANGPVKYLEPTWEIEKNEEGLAIKFSGTLLDITQKKQAELEINKFNMELEQRVKERTTELLKANKDLEDVNDVFIGNQIEIIELKKEIKELKKKLAE